MTIKPQFLCTTVLLIYIKIDKEHMRACFSGLRANHHEYLITIRGNLNCVILFYYVLTQVQFLFKDYVPTALSLFFTMRSRSVQIWSSFHNSFCQLFAQRRKYLFWMCVEEESSEKVWGLQKSEAKLCLGKYKEERKEGREMIIIIITRLSYVFQTVNCGSYAY